MNKTKKSERLLVMLNSLSKEHQVSGGFNNYSQFCEKTLKEMLWHMDGSGLNLFFKKIESVSTCGITRRKPVLEID